MNINDFIRERKAEWELLEAIGGKFRPGAAARLSKEEIWELGKLYHGAVSDLATLKSSELAVDTESHVIAYLNGLVIRVHGVIYRKPPFRWSSIPEYFKTDLPAVMQRSVGYLAVSTGIFLFTGILGFVLGLSETGFTELVVPAHIITLVEKGEVWFNDLYTVAPQASSGLMTHNISVTFLLVATGCSFGLGTVYLLGMNGVLIGGVASVCYKHNLSEEFWSFVLPHGSFELTAVIIAGAAGLLIGHSLLDPGLHRRSEYLAHRGRHVGMLAFGCVPLLVIAGFLEAFFSPSPLPAEVKLAFAAIAFPSLMAYFFFPRNQGGDRPVQETDGQPGQRDVNSFAHLRIE